MNGTEFSKHLKDRIKPGREELDNLSELEIRYIAVSLPKVLWYVLDGTAEKTETDKVSIIEELIILTLLNPLLFSMVTTAADPHGSVQGLTVLFNEAIEYQKTRKEKSNVNI